MFFRLACCLFACYGISTPVEAADPTARAAAVATFQAAGVHPSRKGSLTFLRWRGEPLGEMSQLQLYTAQVNDETLALARHFPEVTLLELRETSVTDAGLQQLQHLPNLETLTFLPINRYEKPGIRIQWSYPTVPMATQPQAITGVGLQQLRHCPRLKQVDLIDTRVTAAGLVALETLPKLSSLSIGFPLDEQAVTHLKRPPKVTHLQLGGKGASIDSLRSLAQLPQIQSLAIEGCPLDASALAAIGQLTHLQKLSLADCHLDDASLAPLGALTGLQLLRVGRNPIRGPGLVAFKNCSQLKILMVDLADLSDDTLKHLTALPALEDLWLNYNLQVTNAGIQSGVLQSIPTLQQLKLRGNQQINDDLLETFVAMKQLKGLVVRSTPFSPEAVAKLRERRPDLNILK